MPFRKVPISLAALRRTDEKNETGRLGAGVCPLGEDKLRAACRAVSRKEGHLKCLGDRINGNLGSCPVRWCEKRLERERCLCQAGWLSIPHLYQEGLRFSVAELTKTFSQRILFPKLHFNFISLFFPFRF